MVVYRGSEFSIDGGSGNNTLQLKTVTTVNLANADQTTGDGAAVSNFQNVDASALGAAQGVSITGSSSANSIIGGAGADTISVRLQARDLRREPVPRRAPSGRNVVDAGHFFERGATVDQTAYGLLSDLLEVVRGPRGKPPL